MYYVGLLVIHALFLLVGLFELCVMNSLFCEVCSIYIYIYILCGCVLLFKVLYFSEKKKMIFNL